MIRYSGNPKTGVRSVTHNILTICKKALSVLAEISFNTRIMLAIQKKTNTINKIFIIIQIFHTLNRYHKSQVDLFKTTQTPVPIKRKLEYKIYYLIDFFKTCKELLYFFKTLSKYIILEGDIASVSIFNVLVQSRLLFRATCKFLTDKSDIDDITLTNVHCQFIILSSNIRL